MFERFAERARLAVVFAQEEARRLGHGEIGADHLLLGIARADPDLLDVASERIRGAIAVRRGPGTPATPAQIPFTAEAMRALESAARGAGGDDPIGAARLLRALLDQDGTARATLEAAPGVPALEPPDFPGAPRPDAPGGPPTPAAPHLPNVPSDPTRPPPTELDETLRAGYPVTVSLGHAGLIGDLGHPRVDARLLTVMLTADGRSARLLRAHGVDEAAIRAALGYPPGDA